MMAAVWAWFFAMLELSTRMCGQLEAARYCRLGWQFSLLWLLLVLCISITLEEFRRKPPDALS